MGWEIDALKTAVSAYAQYEKDKATEASLDSLNSQLVEVRRLIVENHARIIQAIMDIKRDELEGRLNGHLDQFRLLPNLPKASRIIFQSESAYLTGELKALASNKSYKPEYLYDFLRMLVMLAPIHAFGNRIIGVSDVRYLFEGAHALCIDYTKRPPPMRGTKDNWVDPAFRADSKEQAGDKFRQWLDTEVHPLSRMLIEGCWEMCQSSSLLWYASVNGKSVPDILNPTYETGQNMLELWWTVNGRDEFKLVLQMQEEMQRVLDFLPKYLEAPTTGALTYSAGPA